MFIYHLAALFIVLLLTLVIFFLNYMKMYPNIVWHILTAVVYCMVVILMRESVDCNVRMYVPHRLDHAIQWTQRVMLEAKYLVTSL
jgi:hypothetical protein